MNKTTFSFLIHPSVGPGCFYLLTVVNHVAVNTVMKIPVPVSAIDSFFFFGIFIDYAITVVPFLPLHSTPSCPPPPSHIPPL